MNLFTKLLRREAAVVLEQRYGRAVLAFRYGGGALPYGEVVRHWPELEALADFTPDAARLSSPVPDERLPDLLEALANLTAVPGLEVRVADRLLEPAPVPRGEAPEPEVSPEPTEAERPGDILPDAPQGDVAALEAALAAGTCPDASCAALLSVFAGLARQDGPEPFARMLELWRNYIDRVPELAGIPARWIWDYTQVRDTGVAPEALLERLPGLPDPVVDAALTAMERDGAPLRLPAWVLTRLSGYDLASSRFVETFPDQPALEELFSDAVAAVDAALRGAEGRGLLSARCVARTRARQVDAFRGLPEEPPLRYTMYFRKLCRNPRLQTYMKLLLRYIENGLRARYRFGGRLQGEAPDAVSRAAVDAYLAQLPPVEKPGREAALGETVAHEEAAPRRQIALNMADVARLRADSDATRAALLAAVARDAWPEAIEDDEDPPEAMDAGDAAAVVPDQPAEGERPADVEGTTEAATPAIQDAAPGESTLSSNVSEPWRSFLAQADREALAALLEGPSALRALAAARREMPDRLLDGLNEAAADTLGDLIADAGGVYEEYREALTSLLR